MLKTLKNKIRVRFLERFPGIYWYLRGQNYYTARQETRCEKMIHDEVIRQVLSFKPARVLEYGVGNASVLKGINIKEPGIECHGIDISKSQLAVAKKTFTQASFRQCNISKTTYPDDFFDVVYGLGVLIYLQQEERKKSFRELFRICRGTLISVEYVTKHFSRPLLDKFNNAGDYRYDYDIAEGITDAGFKSIIEKKIDFCWDPKINTRGEMPHSIMICTKD